MVVFRIIFKNYLFQKITRMITFTKTKLQKSDDDQTNIDKYTRVAVNITEYNILKKLFRIIIPKFMNIRKLFHVKNVGKMSKIKIKRNKRQLTAKGIISKSLKSIRKY